MTYTHLRVGTKPFRSKPPRKGPPCSEPRLTGTNVLLDPGFEFHLANTTGGPLGDEIPEDGNTYRMEWTDDTEAPATSYWMADKNVDNTEPTKDVRWRISTASPRSGTYHARYLEEAATNDDLWPVAFDVCAWPAGAYGRAAAKVEQGDYLKWSFYAKVTSTTGTPNMYRGIFLLDINGDYVTEIGTVASFSPTASYVQYTSDGFVPTGVAFALPAVGRANNGGGVPTTTGYDVDDCALEVS